MTIPLILFIVLFAATVGAQAWCKILGRNEDDFLHTSEKATSVVSKQAELDQTISKAENLRKILIWATVLWGVVVACLFLWAQWKASTGLGT